MNSSPATPNSFSDSEHESLKLINDIPAEREEAGRYGAAAAARARDPLS